MVVHCNITFLSHYEYDIRNKNLKLNGINLQ